MHKFKIFKNTELSQDEKELLWKRNVSGSRLSKIIDPIQRIQEFKIATGTIIEDKSWTEEPKTKKKLSAGNFFEETIFNFLKKTFDDQGLDLSKRLFIDKRTFVSTDFSNVHANIDAFIITKEAYNLYLDKKITTEDLINYVERIVEIKNTVKDKKDYLIDTYSPQCKFYSWFFNAKENPLLVPFVQGFDLNIIEVTYNQEDFENNELVKIKEWVDCVEKGIEPQMSTVESTENLLFDITNDSNLVTVVQNYRDTKQKIEDLSKYSDEAKAYILNRISQSTSDFKKATLLFGGEPFISISRTYPKRAVQTTDHALLNWNTLLTIAKEKAKQDNIQLEKYLAIEEFAIEKQISQKPTDTFRVIQNKKKEE